MVDLRIHLFIYCIDLQELIHQYFFIISISNRFSINLLFLDESKVNIMAKLTADEKINVYWEGIKYISGLNRSSEIKAGLIISFYGLLIGVVFQLAIEVGSDFSFNYLLIIASIIFLIFVSRSIYFSFKCFLPQIETNFDSNVFFFHDAVTKYGSISDYSRHLINLLEDEERLYEQLGEQIFVNSLIASKKFKDVNKSVKNLVYSFIPLLASGIIIIVQNIF